jgi:hypothetical protein
VSGAAQPLAQLPVRFADTVLTLLCYNNAGAFHSTVAIEEFMKRRRLSKFLCSSFYLALAVWLCVHQCESAPAQTLSGGPDPARKVHNALAACLG